MHHIAWTWALQRPSMGRIALGRNQKLGITTPELGRCGAFPIFCFKKETCATRLLKNLNYPKAYKYLLLSLGRGCLAFFPKKEGANDWRKRKTTGVGVGDEIVSIFGLSLSSFILFFMHNIMFSISCQFSIGLRCSHIVNIESFSLITIQLMFIHVCHVFWSVLNACECLVNLYMN